MRGIDMLAQACAPQEPTQTAAQPQALTDDQCKQIASMVLEQLQGGQTKTEPAPADPDPEPAQEEGENLDDTGESI